MLSGRVVVVFVRAPARTAHRSRSTMERKRPLWPDHARCAQRSRNFNLGTSWSGRPIKKENPALTEKTECSAAEHRQFYVNQSFTTKKKKQQNTHCIIRHLLADMAAAAVADTV